MYISAVGWHKEGSCEAEARPTNLRKAEIKSASHLEHKFWQPTISKRKIG